MSKVKSKKKNFLQKAFSKKKSHHHDDEEVNSDEAMRYKSVPVKKATSSSLFDLDEIMAMVSNNLNDSIELGGQIRSSPGSSSSFLLSGNDFEFTLEYFSESS